MIRTAIVDDHRLFRAGLRKMLDTMSGIRVVGEADSGEAAVRLAADAAPNVMLMDLNMPGIGGLEAIRRISMRHSDVQSIVLSAYETKPFPQQALKAGAMGYVTKGADVKELESAIRRVYLGKRFVTAELAQIMAFDGFDDHDSPFQALSTREMQITLMVVNCQRVQDISNDLHLSPKTVNSYRYRIFEKLNVSSDVELALLAVRHGMLSPSLDGIARRV